MFMCEKNKSQPVWQEVVAGSGATFLMTTLGSLAAMPVSLSSSPFPEAAAGRGRKD